MESLVAVWFIVIMFSRTNVYADYQGDALYDFKIKISDDPKNATQSWDPMLTTPCTWFSISCDKHDKVIRIDLGGAGISGQLAPELGKLDSLQYLELYNNNLDGQIPEEIGNLSNLISLDLYNNRLSGHIPNSLGNLAKLQKLELYDNNLDGQIPEEIGGLSNLISLELQNNNLSGLIPDSLENLKNLQTFRIDHNKLTGPVPLDFPCLKIPEVRVDGNDICGPFTARCIDANNPIQCTNNYTCPCMCGKSYNTACDLDKTPFDNNKCCLM